MIGLTIPPCSADTSGTVRYYLYYDSIVAVWYGRYWSTRQYTVAMLLITVHPDFNIGISGDRDVYTYTST
jgi:hypothetical protein